MMTNVHPLAIVAVTATPATLLGYVIGRAFRFDAAVEQAAALQAADDRSHMRGGRDAHPTAGDQ